MIPYIFSLTNVMAKPLKRWIWNNIIDTKLGWHNDIQCVIDEIRIHTIEDEIDIDELMNERAEEYNTGLQECYDL